MNMVKSMLYTQLIMQWEHASMLKKADTIQIH